MKLLKLQQVGHIPMIFELVQKVFLPPAELQIKLLLSYLLQTRFLRHDLHPRVRHRKIRRPLNPFHFNCVFFWLHLRYP